MKKILLLFTIGIVIAATAFYLYVLLTVGDSDGQQENVEQFSFPAEPLIDKNQNTEENIRLVRNEYQSFVVQNAGTYSWKQFANNGREIPLDHGLIALNVSVPNALQELLKQSDWGIQSCPGNVEKPTFIFRTQVKLMPPDYVGNLYEDQQRIMAQWEDSLFEDVQSVLFPTQYHGTVLDTGTFRFDETYEGYAIRSKPITFTNGSKLPIAYLLLGDFVLISNDIDCLVESSESLIEGD